MFLAGEGPYEKAEGRRRKAEGGRQKAESRRRKAEGRRQKAEGRRRKAEGGRQKAEGRRQKAEGGRQKAEGRRQKAEGRRRDYAIFSGLRMGATWAGLCDPFGIGGGGKAEKAEEKLKLGKQPSEVRDSPSEIVRSISRGKAQ
jgi:hypothetical protein